MYEEILFEMQQFASVLDYHSGRTVRSAGGAGFLAFKNIYELHGIDAAKHAANHLTTDAELMKYTAMK